MDCSTLNGVYHLLLVTLQALTNRYTLLQEIKHHQWSKVTVIRRHHEVAQFSYYSIGFRAEVGREYNID